MTDAVKPASYLAKDAVGAWTGRIHLVANPLAVELINHAINAYGFLVNRNERVTAQDFATRIERTYDCVGCPQNAAVVGALRSLL